MENSAKLASLDRAYHYMQHAIEAIDAYGRDTELCIYSDEAYALDYVRNEHLDALGLIGCLCSRVEHEMRSE